MRRTFILKTTDVCNAACVYCSAWSEKKKEKHLSTEVLERLFQMLVDYGEKTQSHTEWAFTFHGGEPLLRSEKFYEQVMELQERYFIKNNIKFLNLMQSNLLALTPSKAKVIKALLTLDSDQPPRVGTSYDPLPGYRVAKKGSYEKRFFKSLEILHDESIEFGMVHTVHKESLEKLDFIYKEFRRIFPDKGVRLNALYPEGRGRLQEVREYGLESESFGEFLVKFYRLWEADGKPSSYNPLSDWDAFHEKGHHRMACEFVGRCTETHLGLTPDGNICTCGRCIDRGVAPYGRLGDSTLQEILDSNELARMRNRRVVLEMTECHECRWWQYCHGGCIADALMNFDDLYHRTRWCEGFKYFFETIYGEPRKIRRPEKKEDEQVSWLERMI